MAQPGEHQDGWRAALRRVVPDPRRIRSSEADGPPTDPPAPDGTDPDGEDTGPLAIRPAGPPPGGPTTDPGGPTTDPGTSDAASDAAASGGAGEGEPGPSTDPAVIPSTISVREVEARIDEVILHAPRKYTRLDVHELTRMQPEHTRMLWRAMGFADVDDGEVLFNEHDVAAVELFKELVDSGLMTRDVQAAVLRSIAQAMAGLATWQVERLYELLGERRRNAEQWPVDLRIVLPALECLQVHVWRRHLAVAAGRMLAATPPEADIRTLTVGSSDLVGFTRTARRLSPGQLIELVELFHGIAADVVSGRRGRIVKTVGDAVLFATDRPEDAAEIALELQDRTVAAPGLPELRTGLAIGPTLTRFGDVYGEVVDTAARLCTHARPGRILVDHALAVELDGDRRFRLRLRRPVTERGYPRLHPWGLRRGPASA